ncbi:MotA/TolQ/ExbB proton channel family protein [Paraburkholderia xenovorans]|uniref:MotA/TolQ/ExbB proton channel family protein n=1 Tax=Paraburkholderia xenovorans TaxID=36873 RepID=UPI0038BCBA7B
MKKHAFVSVAVALSILSATGASVVPDVAYAQASVSAAPAADAPSAPPQQPGAAAADDQVPAAAVAQTGNPYGLEALWHNGDFVARFVLLVLVAMSMGSWYIIVTKFVEQTRAGRRAKLADEQLWSAPSLASGATQLDERSPFRFIAETGIEAAEHHEEALLEEVDRNTWIQASIDRSIVNVSNRLQDGLAFLATVGSTAPFVGLFGTVWGIYHALTAIGIAGQASIDKVAGPVGEALIMTAIGLAVAVPAVLGYNFLVRRNKSLLERVRAFGAQLHVVLLAGRKRAVRAVASAG